MNKFKLYIIGIISTILAVLAFMVDKKNKTIKQLQIEKELKIIQTKARKLNKKLATQKEVSENAFKTYRDYIARHRELADKLGGLVRKNNKRITVVSQGSNRNSKDS